jgi:hypothetical protein
MTEPPPPPPCVRIKTDQEGFLHAGPGGPASIFDFSDAFKFFIGPAHWVGAISGADGIHVTYCYEQTTFPQPMDLEQRPEYQQYIVMRDVVGTFITGEELLTYDEPDGPGAASPMPNQPVFTDPDGVNQTNVDCDSGLPIGGGTFQCADVISAVADFLDDGEPFPIFVTQISEADWTETIGFDGLHRTYRSADQSREAITLQYRVVNTGIYLVQYQMIKGLYVIPGETFADTINGHTVRFLEPIYLERTRNTNSSSWSSSGLVAVFI